MIVQFFAQEVLETVDVPIREVQAFIDLVKENGYEDGNGERHEFIEAKVEYPKKVTIYLTAKDE
jgi:hypothetical protein